MPTPGRSFTRDEDLAALLRRARRVAVLGIKTEAQGTQPAHYVPAYLAAAGYEVEPVPVYYPDVTEILGRRVFRTVTAVPGPVDIVNVFRRPEDLLGHLDDLLAAAPRAVWLQSGIRSDALAAQLLAAGVDVVQDRCIMVEHRRLGAGR
jgi:predicted CoA-binding protein